MLVGTPEILYVQCALLWWFFFSDWIGYLNFTSCSLKIGFAQRFYGLFKT